MAFVDTAGGSLRRPRRKPHIPVPVPGAQQVGGAQQPPPAVDLSQDPILQQIQAANLSNVQGAQANELAGRKQALIDYGYEPGLDNLYPDQSTQGAAHGNPFSTLANLVYAHQQDTRGIDEGLNQQNLFYSSAHDQATADEQHHYQQNRASAYGGLRSQLSGLGAALLAAQSNAASSNAQGAADAYARYTPPTTTGIGGPGPGTVDHTTLASVLGAGRGGDVIHGLPPIDPAADVQPGAGLGLRPPGQLRRRP